MQKETENNAAVPANANLMRKILEIRKKFKTFTVTEASDKNNPKGESEYKYTPGWRIVETIREELDNMDILLVPEFTILSNKEIAYPVYKMIGNVPMSFQKKEVLYDVKASYTFIDVATGETFGPVVICCAGANGTDKSCASAISFAERYFFLKFFQITTRESSDEVDAHDSDQIPGIRALPAPPDKAIQSVPVGAGPFYGNQAPPAGTGASAAFAQGAPQPYPNQDRQQLQQAAYENAVMRLMVYAAGTSSHASILQESISQLSSVGVDCTVPGFVDRLVETAQARREGRQPKV